MGGAIHCTTHRRQVRNLVSLVHGYAGCFTVGSTWRFHAIWARQEPHVVHKRTIRPHPKQQKDHNGRAQCSRIALSTTLSQDTGKTGGIMTGSPLRGGGVPPRGYHTNGRCEPTTKNPEKLLHSSKVHTVLRARMVPACAARAFTAEAADPRCPTAGTGGGAAGTARTNAVGPPRGVQRSYCTELEIISRYVPAWCPLVRRARTRAEAAHPR